MENVLLHLYFGVKFFHIYDNGLTNKFIQTLSQPHQKLSHLNIQILPWNVPDKISDQLMQHIGMYIFSTGSSLTLTSMGPTETKNFSFFAFFQFFVFREK